MNSSKAKEMIYQFFFLYKKIMAGVRNSKLEMQILTICAYFKDYC